MQAVLALALLAASVSGNSGAPPPSTPPRRALVRCPGADYPDGFYPVTCNTYVRCVQGRRSGRTLTCPDGKVFSPGFQRCVPGNSAACLTDLPPGE